MKSLFGVILVFVIFCFFAEETEAVTVSGTPPQYGAGFDADIIAAWGNIVYDATAELSKYDNQEKLAKGFANANAFSTNVASLEGYQDYSLFAIMTGAMISLQAPAFTYNKEYIQRMRYKIESDGDAYLGVGIGLATVNIGVNAGFIFPGMYINLKYGQIAANIKNINSELEGFTYKELLLGGGINQILFWPRTLVPGALKWRGISIGAGFYYIKTENSITILKSFLTESVGATTYTLTLDPTFKIQVKSETMTIPLDVSTSFILFSIFNFSLGTGVDYNLGYSEIKLKAAGSLYTDYDPTVLGSFKIEGGTKEKKPTTINPKITAGIGFNFSIVKIDIPFAVYYLDAGFSIGLSAGIVW